MCVFLVYDYDDEFPQTILQIYGMVPFALPKKKIYMMSFQDDKNE